MIYKEFSLFIYNAIYSIKITSEQRENLKCDNLHFRGLHDREKNLRVDILKYKVFTLGNGNRKESFKFLFTSFHPLTGSRSSKFYKSWLSVCLSGRRVISYFKKCIGSSI